MMYGKICDYIKEHELFGKGDKIVIGLSGGADSVCLMLILCRLREEYELELYAVHVNHCIRGEDADADAEFCRELAGRYNVPFRCAVVDVPLLAGQLHLTVEEAGRRARYGEFDRELEAREAQKIAVAHHMNDNAETILYRMCRGTGIKGMLGIRQKRDNVIRPLLGVTRDEIIAYLAKEKQGYREDITNADSGYDRNRIRNIIIPELEHINSGTVEHINALAGQLESIYDWYAGCVGEAFDSCIYRGAGECIIDCEKLKMLHPSIRSGLIRRVIGELASSLKDVEQRHVAKVLELAGMESGSSVTLPYNLTAENEYGSIRISVITQGECGNTMTESENTVIGEHGYSVEWQQVYLPGERQYCDTVRLSCSINHKTPNIDNIPKNNCTKWVDYDRIKGKLIIRRWSPDDYIYVNGSCKKKISRYVIDEKIPRRYRDKLLVVADGSHVLWIVGGRASEGGYVGSDTSCLLTLTIG